MPRQLKKVRVESMPEGWLPPVSEKVTTINGYQPPRVEIVKEVYTVAELKASELSIPDASDTFEVVDFDTVAKTLTIKGDHVSDMLSSIVDRYTIGTPITFKEGEQVTCLLHPEDTYDPTTNLYKIDGVSIGRNFFRILKEAAEKGSVLKVASIDENGTVTFEDVQFFNYDRDNKFRRIKNPTSRVHPTFKS